METTVDSQPGLHVRSQNWMVTPGLLMDLLTVAVMLLMTESCGYLAQNAAQSRRGQTTQRSEELGAAFGRNQQ